MYIYLLAASNFDIIRFEKSCCLKNPIDAMSYTNINRNKFGKPGTASSCQGVGTLRPTSQWWTWSPCRGVETRGREYSFTGCTKMGWLSHPLRKHEIIIPDRDEQRLKPRKAPKWEMSPNPFSQSLNMLYIYIPFRSPEGFHVLEPVVKVCVCEGRSLVERGHHQQYMRYSCTIYFPRSQS